MQQADELNLQRERLDETKRQFDEGRSTDLSSLAPILKAAGMDTSALPTGRVSNTILPTLLSLQQKRADKAAKDASGQDIAGQLRAMGTTTSMAPGASVEMPKPGGLMTPPAPGPMPAMTQQTVDPKMAALAKLLPGLLQTHPETAGAMLKDVFIPKKPIALGENATLVNPDTGEPVGTPRTGSAPEPFTPPAGYQASYSVNPKGRVSTTYKPEGADKPERTLSERRAMAEEQARLKPDDPQALAAAARMREAYGYEEKLAGAKAGAQTAATLAGKPLEEGDRTALAAHNNILAATTQAKSFTPEEVQAYVGLINRPVAEAKQALAATFGIGKMDQRFADFKALMGRLQGTAFGEGGKALTAIELSIVTQYTPTGREPGGAAEIMAKLKNLEAFTRIARSTRLKMAQTGRAELDPDEFDRTLLAEMQRAGLPVPGQRPGNGTPTLPGGGKVQWGRDANGNPVRLP